MYRSLSRIRQSLDRLFDEEKTETTVSKWKLIAGALRGLAEVIEENGYYPTIIQQEAITKWMKRYVELELKSQSP